MIIKSAAQLGERIRQRRKELGYTQSFLSEYSGLSASFISNLENGKETAEIGKIMFLMNMLGLDMELRVRGK
ncbi:MAG: helix-turn-helix domain-containing protein [Bacillota bacterium]|nr:helix-turn-helix domain-containing protein [Bacillota bacterium]